MALKRRYLKNPRKIRSYINQDAVIKYGLIPLFMAIIKERIDRLGDVVQMRDDKLPETGLSSHDS